MARKPNYKFEKLDRERRKAAKKQAKLDAKEQARQDTVEPADNAETADAEANTTQNDTARDQSAQADEASGL